MTSRRRLLQTLGVAPLAYVAACRRGASGTPDAAPAPAASSIAASPPPTFPGKASDLVLLTDRPPNLEMPLHYLKHDLTPNEAFFVRWHLANVPTAIDRTTHRLRVMGHVDKSVELTLADLDALDQKEIVAVNQCAGNGRGLAAPRVPGVQWTNGAMGNARWRGPSLASVLAKAGVKAGAVEVTFRGMDTAPLPATPPFVKALSVERALDPDVIVATRMNGELLPLLHGAPARLVVPGHYSTYWVKALEEILITSTPFEGFWMAKAYRIPKNAEANETADALAKETAPIGKMVVRSFLVPPVGAKANTKIALEGVAFDGGSGIAKVEVSTDGGATWQEAKLDPDLHGKYSFRRFRAEWTPPAAGAHRLLSRATSVAGETQTDTPRWNRAGYMRNVPEPTYVSVS